jgi:hypothetical protein
METPSASCLPSPAARTYRIQASNPNVESGI